MPLVLMDMLKHLKVVQINLNISKTCSHLTLYNWTTASFILTSETEKKVECLNVYEYSVCL